jgi:hypothetical protein
VAARTASTSSGDMVVVLVGQAHGRLSRRSTGDCLYLHGAARGLVGGERLAAGEQVDSLVKVARANAWAPRFIRRLLDRRGPEGEAVTVLGPG